jgi:hypothetical protein
VDDNNAKKMKVKVWNKIERDWRNLTKEGLSTRLKNQQGSQGKKIEKWASTNVKEWK